MKLEIIIGVLAGLLDLAIGFVMPVTPFISLVLALTLADVFTGIQAAKKRGEKVYSDGLRRKLLYFVLYTIAILLSQWMALTFAILSFLTYSVAFYICIIEFKSNIENISEATGSPIAKSLSAKIAQIENLFKSK